MPDKVTVAEKLPVSSFKLHGWIGLVIMAVSQVLLIRDHSLIKTWFTPLMWTGYVLFLDALIYRIQQKSYVVNYLRSFLFMLGYSIICWLMFEGYNLHLKNWAYVGLPENLFVRSIGYVWAFATIFPGILFTSKIIDLTGIFEKIKIKSLSITAKFLIILFAVGLIFVLFPLMVPANVAVYLFALVWVGFIFLLEPINYLIGAKSLLRDLEDGKLAKWLSLFLSGIICGFLWEFWNYWSTAKWVYVFPFLTRPKIFEMPLFGFLGFLPFAVEVYVMWNLAVAVLKLEKL
ncbi:MAG: hypothetical protein D6813_06455 [Calditrichaeota bacterium]|nr:MAG: hypothetical protein D6813_06455 [Calditrichota bacterium]